MIWQVAMADLVIDARGLSCPFPVLKARKALRELEPGTTIMVISTDPDSIHHFPSFCNTWGHFLLDAREVEDGFCFIIKRGMDQPL
jgi:tRNA 2-thiouridine synthesizing protein A